MAARGNKSDVVSGNSTINDGGGSHFFVDGDNVTEGAPDQMCAARRTTSKREYKNYFENSGVISGPAIAQNNIGRDFNINYYPPNSQIITGRTENSGPDRDKWTKLIEHYYKEGWMRPLPWKTDLRFDQEDYYVPLAMDNYGKTGVLKKNEAAAEINELFDSFSEGGETRTKRVLVRARGGFGKSTVCMKVVYDWSCGKNTFKALPYGSFLPLLYKLRFLKTDQSLEICLFEFAHLMYSPKQCDKESTRNVLEDLGVKILIILDGYDELEPLLQEHVKQFIRKCTDGECTMFKFASFLVTTRPTNDDDLLCLFQKHYYISDLSVSNAKGLVKKYHRGSFWRSWVFLLKHNVSKLVSLSPFSIFILCWVNKRGSFQTRIENKELNAYLQYILIQANSCNLRDEFGFTPEEILHILFVLGRLCARRIKLTEDVFFQNFPQKYYNFLFRIGVFKVSKPRSDFPATYEPVHKHFLDSLVKFSTCPIFKEGSNEMELFEYLRKPVSQDSKNETSKLSVFVPSTGDPVIEMVKNDISFVFNLKYDQFRLDISSFRQIAKFPEESDLNFFYKMECWTKFKDLLFILYEKTELGQEFCDFSYAFLNSSSITTVFVRFENHTDTNPLQKL